MRDNNVIGKASSAPHSLRIKAGSMSGPVADEVSRAFNIFATARTRMRKKPRRIWEAGVRAECSLTACAGSCVFSVNVDASKDAFDCGSFAHVSPARSGGMFSLPSLFARRSLESFHQSLEPESLSLSRVFFKKEA